MDVPLGRIDRAETVDRATEAVDYAAKYALADGNLNNRRRCLRTETPQESPSVGSSAMARTTPGEWCCTTSMWTGGSVMVTSSVLDPRFAAFFEAHVPARGR